MKNSRRPVLNAILLGLLLVGRSAYCETNTNEKAQALLDEVKKGEHEREMVAKQTELSRLNEDLKRGQKQSDELQKSIQEMGTAVTDASGQLEQFTTQRKRLVQTLELISLRIEAERLKHEGLRMLSDAQSKALGALAHRNEETDLRVKLGTSQAQLLSQRFLPEIAESNVKTPPSKIPSEIAETKKKLLKSERATLAADAAAREAMKAATLKLQQAELASLRVEKKGVELGRDEVPVASEEKAPAPTKKPAVKGQ